MLEGRLVLNCDVEEGKSFIAAFDPATRSTRSFDLQFRDDQWKICQAPS